ncbi:MAG: TIGR01777 family oxidoreductase [Chloroflexota bacterium]
MKIVLAGASGFLGRPLVEALHGAGHEAVVLTRRAGQADVAGARPVQWDARTVDDTWARELVGAGAVVNLAGANIGAKRWTDARKHELRQSRLDATSVIVDALGRAPAEQRPGVLVNASGIDYYGDRGDEVVTEESPPGDSFLARLCVDWEAAAKKAEPLGVRVVLIRTAVVLGRGAVALERLAMPFKLFAGGPLGSGDQWFSWIHLDDIVGLYRLAVENGEARGPVNAVAPDVRREKEVARELGQVLGRPSWAPAPAFALKLALGEQADLVLHGRRAVPQKALALGHQFKYPQLHEALALVLGT